MDVTFFPLAIVICFLKASIDQNEFQLITSIIYDGHLAYLPWSISSMIDICFECTVPKWMLLEQTHVYEQLVFLVSNFILCDSFSQTESMLTFDLDIFKYMLS